MSCPQLRSYSSTCCRYCKMQCKAPPLTILKVLPCPLAVQLLPHSITDEDRHLFPSRAQFIVLRLKQPYGNRFLY